MAGWLGRGREAQLRTVLIEPEEATIAVDDIIIEINGSRITDQKSLRTAIADTPPGERAGMKVWRTGKELELSVTMRLRD